MSQDDPSLLDAHRRNLDYMIENRYREDDGYGYIYFDEKSKLGAMAMAIRTLVRSPFFDQYRDYADKLGATVLAMQQPDGSFVPWWIEPDYAYDSDYLLTFYSGEGLLALIELYQATDDQRYLDAAIRGHEFYLQRYVEEIDEWYYPAYVPRHTISLSKLYKLTEDPRYAEAIFVLNDKLIDEMQVSDQAVADLVGRFYNPLFAHYGTPHSASDGIYVEGVVYALEVAQMLDDQVHIDRYRHALRLGVYNLMTLQYDPEDAYFMVYPERVI